MKSLLVLLSIVVFANATLTVSNTLGSNMVLQREPQQAQVWGTADAGATVTVSFGNQISGVKADANNYWQVSLPATAAGGPYTITINSTTGEKIQFTNVLFGDVYICSGQSNMQFTVDSAFNSSYEVQRANLYPNIRVFSVGTHTISGTPLAELVQTDLTWSVANSKTVGGGNWTYMSAVCWFTGADLYDQLNIPIGLISTNWGGTIIQAWSSPDALAVCKVPVTPFNSSNGPNQPTALYNSMIYPFLTMSIGGALWYQGEANVGQALLYSCMEPAMIADWRSKFGKGYKFPFFFVQLAPWIGDVSYSVAVADIRAAQLVALSKEPYVGFASAVDLGDPTSPFNPIHPRNKQEVGRRLAASIMHVGYGKTSVVWQGPTFASATTTTNGKLVIVDVTFTTYGSPGLTFMPASCPSQVPSNQCENWEVSFSDGNWYPTMNATSSVKNVVSVSIAAPSSSLKPTGIRYAYSIWPLTTIFSAEGLPAIPFTTTF